MSILNYKPFQRRAVGTGQSTLNPADYGVNIAEADARALMLANPIGNWGEYSGLAGAGAVPNDTGVLHTPAGLTPPAVMPGRNAELANLNTNMPNWVNIPQDWANTPRDPGQQSSWSGAGYSGPLTGRNESLANLNSGTNALATAPTTPTIDASAGYSGSLTGRNEALANLNTGTSPSALTSATDAFSSYLPNSFGTANPLNAGQQFGADFISGLSNAFSGAQPAQNSFASLYNQGGAVYKQEGGTLPGAGVQTEVDDYLYGPDAEAFAYDPNFDTQIANYADWVSQPGNIPPYYSGDTVAAPGASTEDAWVRYEDAAGEMDTITDQLISDYQAQLDPDSELNRQYAQNAANRAGSTYYGAGTPGSARGQYASQVAAQDIYRDRRDAALKGLGAQRSELDAGADLISRVGKEKRDIAQDYINEDIKRWNYYQTLPQQVQEQLLALAAAQTGLAEGQNYQAPELGINVEDSFSELYNQGGPVYRQMGGPVPPGPQAGPPMGQPPMAPPPMQQAPAGIMGDPMAPSPMMMEEPMSEIDRIEEVLQSLVASSDGEITIKRKSKKKGSK